MTNKIRSVDIEKIDNGYQAEWTVITKKKNPEDYDNYDRHTMFFPDMEQLTKWLKTFDFTPAA